MYSPWRAGRIPAMKIVGLCTPHSLFFSPEKKRECAVHGGREKKTFLRGTGGAPEGAAVRYE